MNYPIFPLTSKDPQAMLLLVWAILACAKRNAKVAKSLTEN
jgi:hypothetical protein